MNGKIREIRRISLHDLRNLCIEKDWYTKGDNEDYNRLLINLADDKENITTDDIVEIAQDIMAHSETDQELTSICFDVARIAITFFEEV